MSIRSYLNELENIRQEITNLNMRKKKLKEQEKKVEENIASFLKSKAQSGVKNDNFFVVLEQKETREKKGKKEKDEEALEILKNCGVENPESVLEKMKEAQKGAPTTKEKLVVGRVKQK